MDGSNFRTVFEKGHPRNITVKLFQNQTSCFGEEDFLWLPSCPYSVKSPHSPEPYLWTYQNLWTLFEKGHPRNISVKLFQNLTSGFREEDFLRIPSSLYSTRSPHSPEPCFWTDQNFANNFWKRSPKEHFFKIISKLDQQFQMRRFLKNCLKNSISWPWQPEFLMESNSVNNFWRGPPKGTFLQSLVQLGPAV